MPQPDQKKNFPQDFLHPAIYFEIVNLEQNITSRAIILNNTEMDGLLIKLSPDLAAALSIKPGTNIRVRVSVPPLVAEEGADPVLIGKKEPHSAQPAVSPIQETPAPKIEPKVMDAPLIAAAPRKKEIAEPTPQDVAEPHTPVRQAAATTQAPSEVKKPIQPTTVQKPNTQPVSEITEPVTPKAQETPPPEMVAEAAAPATPPQAAAEQEDILPVLALAPVPEAPAENTYKTEPVPQVAAIAASGRNTEETASAPVPEIAAPTAPTAGTAETVRPVEEVSTPEPPIVAEEAEPPLYDADDSIPESLDAPEEDEAVLEAAPLEQAKEKSAPIESDVPQTVEPIAIEEPAQPIPETVEPVKEPEPVQEPAPTDEQPVEEPQPNATAETEQHVMLVPADPKAPVGESPREDSASKKRAEESPLAAAPVVKTPPTAQPAEEPYTTSTLKKGAFYVQIGRFSDTLNVQSFVQRYGKQYPITVEKSSNAAGNVYKIYIGPLQKDERGAALETFQRYGFKDAFLKKAP